VTEPRAPILPIEDRLLTIREVGELTGLRERTIYRRIRAGSFPAPYKPGGFSSRWSGREVIEWRSALMEGRAA